VAYQAARELDKSIEELEKAIEIKPDLAQAHSMIVRVYTMQGNEEKAVAHCREFIRLASGSDDPGLKNRIPEMQVRICVMQGDKENAIMHFKEFARLASDDPVLKVRISELESLMSKLEGDKQ
jgi:tetratricopeptide (TPR) repeat protein